MAQEENGSGRRGGGGAAAAVASARGALSALMDAPHPLDILGDPSAYGPEGAISRFHNPDNYTAALGGVLRAQVAPRCPPRVEATENRRCVLMAATVTSESNRA